MQGKKGSGWSFGKNVHGHRRGFCRSCLKEVSCKPSPNCISEEHKKFYQKTKVQKKEYMQRADHGNIARWEVKRELVKLLGGKCVRCGIDDIRLLQINHKLNNGKEDRKKYLCNSFYRAILRGDRPFNDLELRCANCNILYDYEVGRKKVYEKRELEKVLRVD